LTLRRVRSTFPDRRSRGVVGKLLRAQPTVLSVRRSVRVLRSGPRTHAGLSVADSDP